MNGLPLDADAYELIGRQMGHLIRQGLSQDEAKARLLGVGDDRFKHDVQQLLGFLATDDTPSDQRHLERTALGTVKTLARTAARYRAPGEGVLAHVSAVFGSLAESYRVYWAGISGLALYVGVLLLFMTLAIGLYAIFVFPQFSQLFAESHAALPHLTEMLLSLGPGAALLLLVLSLAVIALLARAAYEVRTATQRLRPMRGVSSWLPGIARLARTYNDSLMAKAALVLARAGVPAKSAVEEAWQLVQSGADRRRTATPGTRGDIEAAMTRSPIAARVWLAHQLNTVEPELEVLVQEAEAIFAAQLMDIREKLTVAAQVAVGMLIATVVVAMYLPIFKLGSIV